MGRVEVVLCFSEFNPTAGRGPAGRMSSAAKFCIDATLDALREMERGNLADCLPGPQAAETAIRLANEENVDFFVWIPFQLITRDHYKKFPNK